MAAQAFYTEIIMFKYPEAGAERTLVAWLAFAGVLVAAIFFLLLLTTVFTCADTSNQTRLRVFTLLLVLPMIALQPALTETFYYRYPDDKSARLLAMGITALLLSILAIIVCEIVCNACCKERWKQIDFFLLRNEE